MVDALHALSLLDKKAAKFDIVYIGAPYDSPKLEQVLAKLGEASLLRESGCIVAEHRKQHKLLEVYGSLKAVRETKYGETVLTFYESSHLSG